MKLNLTNNQLTTLKVIMSEAEIADFSILADKTIEELDRFECISDFVELNDHARKILNTSVEDAKEFGFLNQYKVLAKLNKQIFA